MSLLRIYAPLDTAPERCVWSLLDGRTAPVSGESTLAELPKLATKIQLVLRSADVLLTTARLPAGTKRLSEQVLAFALEEKTARDPDLNSVFRIGNPPENDVLAAVDKTALSRWQNALKGAGISAYDICCETLMLPLPERTWSLAWNGTEGFIRTSPLEGCTTDRGDRSTPPMSLELLIDHARMDGSLPTALTVYPSDADAVPDTGQWQKRLGIPVSIGSAWNWRSAPDDANVRLSREQQHWQLSGDLWRQLRPAMWISVAALALYTAALTADWIRLGAEHRSLRQGMESRFRALFPETVAVVDPALQTRRKLAETRHAAGLADASDFLPLVDKVASELKNLPADSIRVLTYENGRLTLEIRGIDAGATQRIVTALRQSGLAVDTQTSGSKSGASITTILVRAS